MDLTIAKKNVLIFFYLTKKAGALLNKVTELKWYDEGHIGVLFRYQNQHAQSTAIKYISVANNRINTDPVIFYPNLATFSVYRGLISAFKQQYTNGASRLRREEIQQQLMTQCIRMRVTKVIRE